MQVKVRQQQFLQRLHALCRVYAHFRAQKALKNSQFRELGTATLQSMPNATPTAPVIPANPAAPAAPVIALVEDEPVLLEELSFQLRHRGLPVLGFADATGLYRHLATQRLAVVVLDVGLPGEDGFSIAKLLRSHDPQLGIVFLTARSLRQDKLAGWQAGADAYLLKPVDMDELEMLLCRLLERQAALAPAAPEPAPSAAKEVLPEQPWKLHLSGALLLAPDGSKVKLTLTELQLLGELARKRGKTCQHLELARAMGLQPDEWDRHRIEVIVSRLRSKVERQTGYEAPIRTVRGLGYVWVVDGC